MRVVRLEESGRGPHGGPLFVGTVQRLGIVNEAESDLLRLNEVSFLAGAVNKFHTHTFDQVLVITEGVGLVQVKGGPERRVTTGDVIFFKAGESHWHGAAPGATMRHVAIGTPGSTQLDPE